MSAWVLFGFVAAYFGLLLAVAWATSRRAGNAEFYIGGRSSHWGLVAFGMIGTSLSGVTFVSVPGAVSTGGFGYYQITIGYFIGYLVIAAVLLPLYYHLKLTSIYHYLQLRFGARSYRTGALFFIASRTLGATARLYLVVRILQDMVLSPLDVPFWLSTAVILLMILLYTVEGGVKTIVWTDTLQTAGMLAGLAICVWMILDAMGVSPAEAWAQIDAANLNRLWRHDPMAADHWAKQLVAGAFITIAMTGMDQEMMQKNISVRTLRGAQLNMLSMAVLMQAVLLLFLFLGALLALYAQAQGISAKGDRLFPAVVMGHLPAWVQVVFILALISALFPSADGALTALTSSTCIDLLNLPNKPGISEAQRLRWRRAVHGGFAGLFLLLVLGFRWVDDPSMIGVVLKLAGYTYGPLLGLFGFGLLTRRVVRDRAVPAVALAAPLLCWVLDAHQAQWLGGYKVGLELLLVNGALTFAGLWWVSRPAGQAQSASPLGTGAAAGSAGASTASPR